MRIYLDCTETYRSTHNTGIQRVVRNLVNESLRLPLPAGVECQPVIRHRHTWRSVGEIRNPATKRQRRVCDAAWYRLGAGAICRAIPAPKLRKWLMPPHGHRGLFHVPYSLGRRIRRLGLGFLPEVEPEAGDVMLSLDLGLKRDWQEMDQLIQAGVKLGGVLYDLEPIDHPRFFSDKLAGRFVDWLKESSARYDFLLTISETVRKRFLDYVAENRVFTHLNAENVASFRLGSDLDGLQPGSTGSSDIRSSLRDALESSTLPTFLTVGTIEPRKNHTLLLDAFDQAWAAGADIRCLIVGVIGWKCDEVIKRIESHPEFGQRLLVYHDLTDAELACAYSQSNAFVYPTHAEGFGLPVVEAQRMGLPVIASDIPILRETSAGKALFFDNESPAQLTRLLTSFAAEGMPFKVSSPSETMAISWGGSAESFFDQVLAFSGIDQRKSVARKFMAA